jgi:hypothetical protein
MGKGRSQMRSLGNVSKLADGWTGLEFLAELLNPKFSELLESTGADPSLLFLLHFYFLFFLMFRFLVAHTS